MLGHRQLIYPSKHTLTHTHIHTLSQLVATTIYNKLLSYCVTTTIVGRFKRMPWEWTNNNSRRLVKEAGIKIMT